VTKEDFEGHETYQNDKEMLKTYRGYYGEKLNEDSVVKIIRFKLTK